MALNLTQKKAVVEDVSKMAESALSMVAAEYSGITVEGMTILRRMALEAGVDVRVVKNSLTKIALKDSSFECMNEILSGQTVLGFSQEDPGGAARVFRNFAKENDKLKVTGLSLGDTLLDNTALEQVANLPTYDQAIAILMGTMKAPVEKLVRTLAAPHTKLVRTVDAIRDQKDAA